MSRLPVFVFSGLILALLLAACGNPNAGGDDASPGEPPPERDVTLLPEPDLSKLLGNLPSLARGEPPWNRSCLFGNQNPDSPDSLISVYTLVEALEPLEEFEAGVEALGGRLRGRSGFDREKETVHVNARIPIGQLVAFSHLPGLIWAAGDECIEATPGLPPQG